jgi:uncharacterized protein YdeI (YjbR/CyaY-like superfamily)
VVSAQSSSEPIFFDGPDHFREWLEAHHDTADEVHVGFWKKHTGRQTMTWSQAVDVALCFGWIDGKLNRIDDERHRQRFTPRRPGSNWSKVNVEKMARLEAEGLMTDAGRRAFEQRDEAKTGVYSFEREERPDELPPEYARLLTPAAHEYFRARAPGYRRGAVHWVTSAKREETRQKRMRTLVECSEEGVDVPPLRR